MGQIACLVNEDLLDVGRFGLDFEDALSLDCEWQFFGSSVQMLDAFSSGFNPQVVLIHFEHVPLIDIHHLIRGLRVSDPDLCLLLLTGKPLLREEIMGWLDQGINGVMKLPFDPLLVSDPLVEILKKKLGYRRSAPRVDVLEPISIQMASIEQAIVAETLNISCTGLFMRVVPKDVRVGELVEFNLKLSNPLSGSEATSINPLDAIEESKSQLSTKIFGKAEIVWVRSSPKDGQPEGLGLRFLDIGEPGLDALRAYIAKRRLSAMIPEGV